jgi:dolichol-phosphate mannosyltransferase
MTHSPVPISDALHASSDSVRALQSAVANPSRIVVALELAVVVPTYNERANIPVLIERLERVLSGVRYEVIIVDDDSPDGTAAAVREIARYRENVRIIRRINRRGLASACLEGMLSTAADYVAVMDGDLQHDEQILLAMFQRASTGKLDLVVASRNLEGGSMGEFSKLRTWISNAGKSLSRLVVQTTVSDPMSGYFLVDRRVVEEAIYRTSGVGFKILLDLLASVRRPLAVAEVPYTFRMREAGESKLDANVGLEYIYLLLDKMIGRFVPVSFVLYSLVGAAGVLLHLGTLQLLGSLEFQTAQLIATAVSMTFNFVLNNAVTHRAVRLRGRGQWLWGLATFYAGCSVGALVNLSVAAKLLEAGFPRLAAGFGGLVLSSVWNYGVTSVITWRRSAKTIDQRQNQPS